MLRSGKGYVNIVKSCSILRSPVRFPDILVVKSLSTYSSPPNPAVLNLRTKVLLFQILVLLFQTYDGSKCAESALDDLVSAGLPDVGEALVVLLAEVWLPRKNGNGVPSLELTGINLDSERSAAIEERYRKNAKAVAEAATLANHAEQRLKRILPNWEVKAEGSYGSPAWEILTQADKLSPDLILVGSHGRSASSRFFLGSISLKVLAEANCSVRVSRGRIEVDPATVRIIIGMGREERRLRLRLLRRGVGQMGVRFDWLP